MLAITLAAEYRGIKVIKKISLFYQIYNGPTITVFDGRNIFPISFTTFYLLIKLRRQHLPSIFNTDLKKNVSLAVFLTARNCLDSRFNSSRWCCPNFILLYAFLSFNINRLTSLSYYSGSGSFLSILRGTKRWIL